MSVSMVDQQTVVLTAVEKDADEAVVTISSQLSWDVDNSSVVSLAVSDDTLSAVATAAGPGTAMVTVTDSTANLVSAPFEIDVAAGAATSIEIEAGTPEDASA